MGKIIENEEIFGSDDSADIKYDNTSSGLNSTKVQDAIDELAAVYKNNFNEESF